MKSRLLIMTTIAVLLAFSFTACQQTDVIGKTAKTTFGTLVDKLGSNVASDNENNIWTLTSPGGERFIWGKDLGDMPDVAIEFDAAPFINAGLDVSMLPTDIYLYDQAKNKIIITRDLGKPQNAPKANATPAEGFAQIVDTNREAIGYHAKLDHYNIALGNGNMFEWAKDMSKNDKDMVFVLNPKPFIDAGVDPAKVTGWVFAKVEVLDQNNKPIQVDKFLKPYDISK